jgi:hypothetical protein
MAKQLEVSLYRNARSFEAYTDMSTLKQRLQQIAVEVSRRARNEGDQRDDRSRDRQQSNSSSSTMRPDSNSGTAAPYMSSNHQPMPSNRGQIVNPNEINPLANNNSTGMPNMNMGNIGGNMGGNMGPGLDGNIGSSNYGHNPQQRPMPNSRSTNAPAGGAIPSGGAQNRNDPEWKVRIRHKQQRLLLLHHSAKCPHEDGRCTVTPHCADMKKLWKHMEGCKDNQCRVSHCFSSRAILSHYRKCKDPACPACGPVRETVRRSQNRSSSGSNSSMRSSSQNNPMMNGISDNNRMMSGSSQSNQQHPMMSNDMSSSQGASFANNPMAAPFNQSQSQPSQPVMPPPANSTSGNSAVQFNRPSTSPPNPQQQFRTMPSAPGVGNSSSSSQPAFPSNDPARARGSSSGAGNDVSMNALRSPSVGMVQMNDSDPSSSRRNDTEWQKIRNKQQRLLLLRHASRCQYAGKCPVTPHCASMKKLWEHIAVCKNQQCDVPHCMSSRYVLSHYRRCKDARCPACEPVRETIRKSHEKERGRGQQQPSNSALSFDQPPQESSETPSNVNPPAVGSVNSGASPDYAPPTKRAKVEHQGSMGASSATSLQSHTSKALIQSNPAVSKPTPSVSVPSKGSVKPPETPSIAVAPPTVNATLPAKPETKEKTKTQGTEPKNEDRSLLNGFTVGQLTTHLASLNRAAQLPPAKLKQECLQVLKGLQQHQHGWVFNVPVDPVELGLPDYFEIIKKPMDLGTIHKKLDGGAYHHLEDFQCDVNLTFDNAMAYNEENTVVYDMAKELKIKFDADFKKLVDQLESEDQERRQNERACVLCGCEKRLFEPPVFFCNGMNCQSKRIRRNSHFYIGGNNQYFWCNQCFNDLDEKTPIELIDLTIAKTELKKKKNDEVHEESWVQCDVCNRWIHQICGLFNTRQNKEHHSEYCCPLCLLKKRKKAPVTPPPKPPGAADLPRTKLSEFLEKGVTQKIEDKKKQMVEDKTRVEVSIVLSFNVIVENPRLNDCGDARTCQRRTRAR